LGLALRGVATAAIDVSDGLLADLGHIAERSGLAAAVRLVQLPHLPKGETPDALPRALALDAQLAGGDDYELCFTAPPEARLAIGKIAADLELPLWCIGDMQEPGAGTVTVYDPDGQAIPLPHQGFDHFPGD
ncbi:MAG TPA: thiamine-phosphate kinase, partial [Rhodocyclaceae bacterium]|nr:thiamine-phosphate kinase [Rhodocyclaceae bacterium]